MPFEIKELFLSSLRFQAQERRSKVHLISFLYNFQQYLLLPYRIQGRKHLKNST